MYWGLIEFDWHNKLGSLLIKCYIGDLKIEAPNICPRDEVKVARYVINMILKLK